MKNRWIRSTGGHSGAMGAATGGRNRERGRARRGNRETPLARALKYLLRLWSGCTALTSGCTAPWYYPRVRGGTFIA